MTLKTDIKKYKTALIAKAKAKGLYENFGQKEITKLEEKLSKVENRMPEEIELKYIPPL